MGDAINSVERAFLKLFRGEALSPPRTIIDTGDGSVLYMPCYLEKPVMKVVSVFPKNPRRGLPTIFATVQLNDPETGEPLALMEGGYLTAVRTGATSGVATRYLAREDSTIAGIIGAGVQARTQLWAICEIRKIEKARVYDVDPKAASSFAWEMSKKLGIEITVRDSAQEVVRGSDILILATTSKTPVMDGSWLDRGCHINSVGWVGPKGRELDSKTVKTSKLFVDSRESVLKESGDIIIPMEEGGMDETHICAELGELIAGKGKGRTSDDDITLFKSVGLAIMDGAIATVALKRALEKKVGQEVELYSPRE